MKLKGIIIVGVIITILVVSPAISVSVTNGKEIIYDKNADLPICVYKEIKDCKTRSGLICEVETTIDPCQDIFHGFTGTDENYKPETNQFIVPADVNSDDTMVNDIPPDGEGLFCDHPSNPGGCYDRNDNPEEFCVNHQQYTLFCEIIGDICDDNKTNNAISSTDPECTDENSPCPENYVRYNEYCASYRVDCDENPTNVYCTGQRRTDGLQRCDEPEHPGYKFCNRDN